MSVVAIGKNSFLGQAAAKHPDTADWRFISHKEALNPESYKGASCVVNFALHADVKRGILTQETDLDSAVARLIKNTDINYVMLSSRTVYGAAMNEDAITETSALHPVTGYGIAKKQIEENILQILGPDRVTILRLSTIFGFEPDEKRQSFFSMALCKLMSEGIIEYKMSPNVRRDFLSADRCADALIKICNHVRPGIYNVGSGIGLETGDIAAWLIEGYGEGRLVVTNPEPSDAFWLEMTKTRNAFNIPVITRDDLKNDCILIGQALRKFVNEREEGSYGQASSNNSNR